ncbi:MAG: glycoside hydrolase family 9 protein [Prevotella sp.]|nr:glycoside hydrolase family 9 protein [Prevotella sp.]
MKIDLKMKIRYGLIMMLAWLGMSSMQAKPIVEIRLNQVGYYPDEEKVVVFEGINAKEKITVTDEQGNVVLQPKVMRQAISPWSKKKRFIVDVSELNTPGKYTIAVKGAERQFVVNQAALRDISHASLKFFYLMRTGIPIDKEYAGEYARPVGHPDLHVLIHPSAASQGRPAGSVISSPLGWYDAGDYNKYVVNSSFSIGLMMLVYEQNKPYFHSLNLNIPESKNATADFLDEMMFNLRWLLTMQDPEDGGVYHKLTTPNFEGFVKPTDCKQPRYVVAKSVTAAYDFAAVMAQSSRLLDGNGDYVDFSYQAAEAAKRAYEWAKNHPQAFYRQGSMNRQFQPAVNTGEYGDGSANDEQFWAATEMYRLTKEDKYLQDAKNLKPSRFTTPTWGNVAGLGIFSWINAGESEMQSEMLQQLKDYCEQLISRVPTSSFQAPYGDRMEDFGWGCLAEHCCVPGVALLYADRYIAPNRYRGYALQNVDYLLGRNATGYCYVTGFGQKSPMHPHHRISSSDGIEKPFPGMLVGGPNPMQQDKSSGNLVYPSSFPDESYLDEEPSYASNEIAINWNASLVAFLCWMDALKSQTLW